ncbi:uncharacterized protein LOC111694010 [Trichogramma pretiosum]|uniref:uncharacterized protein LOC111694010 n=1 Tax=Trichogramma pretiosum TaxID=7493 RepID=UPI000C7189E7|nr:uncharacterized protein LOC111694010 [Trichogramma pretiosum]
MSQKMIRAMKDLKLNNVECKSDIKKSEEDQHCNSDFINILKVLDDEFQSYKESVISDLQSRASTSKPTKSSTNIKVYGLEFINSFINDKSYECNFYENSFNRQVSLGGSLDLIINSKLRNGKQYFHCVVCRKNYNPDYFTLIEHIISASHMKNLQSLIEYATQYNHDEIQNITWFAENYISVKWDDAKARCHACQVNLIREEDRQLHMQTNSHVKKVQQIKVYDIKQKILAIIEDVWYYTRFFNCTLCNEEFDTEMEFLEHLKSDDHYNIELPFRAIGGEIVFLTCFACETGFYGDLRKYYEHCEDIFHKRYSKIGDFVLSEMTPPLLKLLDNIEDSKQKCIKESNSVILEDEQEQNVLKEIIKVVECIYPNAKAHIFGSRCSQTALSNSDLDIFLDCDDMYFKDCNSVLDLKHLKSVIKCLNNHKDDWYIFEVLDEARIPIIKLRHYPSGLDCDISFSNGLAHRKSKLIRYYNDAYPMCRELILYLKKWVVYSQLSGPEGISTFTISWLVIFYLQCKGVFRNVYDLLKAQRSSTMIDDWECGYREDFCLKSNSNSSFVDHLVGFFEFYAKFDFHKNVICPYLGITLEKENFAKMELPSSLLSILSVKKKKDVSLLQFDSPMCMQDPTELGQNSTKALKKRQLRWFREYCSISAEKIKSQRSQNSTKVLKKCHFWCLREYSSARAKERKPL